MRQFILLTKLLGMAGVLAFFNNTSYAQFPAPYCSPIYNWSVEPISRFEMANVVNTSPYATSGASEIEDFLSQTINVVAGNTYTVTIDGNTDGSYTNYVGVFIDLNQNNTFDASEYFPIGSLYANPGDGSGTPAVGTITIPSNTVPMTTRLRVAKEYNATPLPCSGEFGQMEDYTIVITNPNASSTCTNPTLITFGTSTTNSVPVSFTASTSTVLNYEYYVSTTNTAPTATSTPTGTTTSTSYTIGSLNPNTQYYVWMRAVCSATDKSVWIGGSSFTTQCASMVLPFTSTLGGSLPLCWTNTNNINSTNANMFWKFTGITDYGNNGRASGTFAWVDASSPYSSITGANEVYLTTNNIDFTGITTPYLSFDYHSNAVGANNTFRVEVLLGTTWTTLFTSNTSSTSWRSQNMMLPPTSTKIRFVVDKNSNTFYDDFALTNVYIGNAPSCFAPTSIVANKVAHNYAQFTIAPPAVVPTNGYGYYVSTTSTAPTATTTYTTTTANTFNVASLTPNTTYYLWIKSLCSTNDQSQWSAPVTFKTALLDATPYTQVFTTTTTPTAWTINNATVGSVRGVTGNGNNNVYKNLYSSGTIGSIVTSHFAPISANFEFNFDFKTSDYYSPYAAVAANLVKLRIYVAENFSSNYILIDSINNQNINSWINKSVNLSNYVNDTVSFKIEYESLAGSYDFDLGIDNIKVRPIPLCPDPTQLTSSNISFTVANVNWAYNGTGTATFEYYSSTSNTAPTATTTPTGNTQNNFVNFSNLLSNTTYYVWVRNQCGTTPNGWVGPINFTTLPIATVPYSQPFTTTTTPVGYTLTNFNIGSTRGVTGNPGNNIYTNVYSSYPIASFTTINIGTLPNNSVLTYDYKASNYSTPYSSVALGSGAIEVLISTDLGQTFVPIDSMDVPNVNTWQNSTVSLSQFTNDTIQLKFVVNRFLGDFDVAFDNIQINAVPCTLSYTLGNDTTYCPGGATITLNAPTGTGYTYNWSNGSTAASQSFTNFNGPVWVNVNNGICNVSDTINLSLYTNSAINLGNDTNYCADATITLNAPTGTGYTYNWSNAGTTASQSFTNVNGYVWVDVFDGTCTLRDSLYLALHNNPTINLGNDTTICHFDSVLLSPIPSLPYYAGTFLWSDNSTLPHNMVEGPGTYYLTFTDTFNCSASDTIVVSAFPSASITDMQITDNGANSYTFEAIGVQNATGVYWSYGDNNYGQGTIVNHTYANPGTYDVTVLVVDTCYDTVTIQRQVDVTVGVKDVIVRNNIKIYPNPTSDLIQIKAQNGLIIESIRISNQIGQTISSEPVNSDSYQIHMNKYASGNYFMEIKTNKGSTIEKITVIK